MTRLEQISFVTQEACRRHCHPKSPAGPEGLLGIINDALDWSRFEAGQLRRDPTDFDLARVIEETVALLAPAAHEKCLEPTCEIDPAPETGLELTRACARLRAELKRLNVTRP